MGRDENYIHTNEFLLSEYYTDRDILNIKLVESEEVCVLPRTKYNLSFLLHCQRIWLKVYAKDRVDILLLFYFFSYGN